MEIGVVDDCSVSAMHENTELGRGVLTIICRDCARVIIAEDGEHLLVVCEIDETNIALHSSNRRCQFLKHTRASLPWLIPGLDGLASERIGREILPVEVVRASGRLGQQFAGAVSKKFMDCRHNETDNVIAASEPLDLRRMHIVAGATGIVVSTHAIGKDDVLEAAGLPNFAVL